MVFRQVIGALAIVTFAATSVLCCCKPTFAAAHHKAAEGESGCHGGHHASPDGKGKPSHDEQDSCQHCHGGQFLETRDAAKTFTAPALHPLFVLPIATVVFRSADQALSHRLMPPSRAAPPPLYLLKSVLLI